MQIDERWRFSVLIAFDLKSRNAFSKYTWAFMRAIMFQFFFLFLSFFVVNFVFITNIVKGKYQRNIRQNKRNKRRKKVIHAIRFLRSMMISTWCKKFYSICAIRLGIFRANREIGTFVMLSSVLIIFSEKNYCCMYYCLWLKGKKHSKKIPPNF